MNPSSAGIWCNPPPPGTDEDLSNSSVKKATPERVIDRIDPYLKSSEYIKYEKKRRSRSRSHHHHRRRSRSRSRGRHRRHRRRHSSSRSRSRSRSRRRHKRSRHSRSQSRSRSRRHRRRSHSRPKEPAVEERRPPAEAEEDVEEEEDDGNENVFKNDGSFLEMFKKMQEEQLIKQEPGEAAEAKVALPAFGKRRGGKILKTGMVQKSKTSGQEDGESQDAWTLYMKEVKRYKEACCDDDSKTRLLVK